MGSNNVAIHRDIKVNPEDMIDEMSNKKPGNKI